MTKLEKILTERKIYISPAARPIGLNKFGPSVGINRCTLSKHINGKLVMSNESLKKIADYLGISLNELID